MAGRSKSKAEKQCRKALDKEEALVYAIKLHQQDQTKPEIERRSLRALCQETVKEMKRREKNVTISHVTLKRRLDGGRSCLAANKENFGWLAPEEEESIVAYCLELAARGFPLTHETLKDHVDTLLQARLGSAFPKNGVGKNWTDRFLTRNHHRIHVYWSSSLDSNRGRAVNEHTHKAWCDLLRHTLDEQGIEQDCIWAADETGFQPGIGQRKRVIGPVRRKMQYQQRDGTKETITVMVTICADGSTIPPLCIYKGQSFSTNWHQDNTLQASVAHSEKGWTNGTIGRLWVEDFDNKTCHKANGRPRLLLVDGHNSHYTESFLTYAREHKIHVLCYPAHTTHIYQGLDVVIFGPLKRCWSDEQDRHKSATGQKITKQSFISVYAKAHQKVLTPELIRTAFEKTGVWPFNPDIVTKEMMAPSLETSSRGCLPLPQPSPVRAVTSMIHQYQRMNAQPPFTRTATPHDTERHHDNDDQFSMFANEQIPVAGPSSNQWLSLGPATSRQLEWQAAARETVDLLTSTSAGFLVNETPISSSQRLPQYIPSPLSPTRHRTHPLLEKEPTGPYELAYQNELRESYRREAVYKGQLVGTQSTMVLQAIYCDRLSEQLASREDKRKGKKRGKLNGDGMPKLLTREDFQVRVEEHAAEQARLRREQERRRMQRGAQLALMVTWKEADEARKRRNNEVKETYHEEMRVWKEEKELARQEGRRTAWPKPKRGKLEKVSPKPTVENVDGADDGNENVVNEGMETDSGGSEDEC